MQVVWQEADKTGSINVDEWWRGVEYKLLEAVVYKSAKAEPVLANEIAPWLPPSCRGTVINTEHLKSSMNDDIFNAHWVSKEASRADPKWCV